MTRQPAGPTKLVNAIREGRYDWVAGWVAGAFDLDVTTEQIESAFQRHEHRGDAFRSDWTDGTASLWVKNRLCEMGCFQPGMNTPDDSHTTALLHVFFVSIQETPDMVQRLRNETVEAIADAIRSKIFRTPLKPKPIDSVAGRVSKIRPSDN